MSTDEYLTDRHLAARFAVSRNTVWRWARSGDLPKPVKLGSGVTRWRIADILRWERARSLTAPGRVTLPMNGEKCAAREAQK